MNERSLTPSLLLSLGLVLLLVACGSGSDGASSPAAQTAKPEQNPAGALALPAPAALPRGTSAAGQTRSASSYDPALPSANVSKKDGRLRLTPLPGGGLESNAYAVYQFDLTGLTGPQTLKLLQNDANYSSLSPSLYLGFANFSTGRWQWKRASAQAVSGSFPLSNVADYMNQDGLAFVTVQLGGNQSFLLDSLSFQRYDETEPNDAVAEGLNDLPPGDFGNIRGSLGSSVDYPGYDGDAQDFWLIHYVPGGQISATVKYDTAAADFEVAILQGESPLGTSSEEHGDHVTVQASLLDPDGLPLSGPFYLRITALSGASDYSVASNQSRAPSAQFSQDKVCGAAPLAVSFDAALSSDTDGSIVSYSWSMDDAAQSSPLSGQQVNWVFTGADKISHRVTLTVTDNEGFSDTRTRLFRIDNGGYTEWEDNDNYHQAQPLLSPTGEIAGNIGFDETNGAFDGDTHDESFYLLDPGQTIIFKLLSYDHVNPDANILANCLGAQGSLQFNAKGEGRYPLTPDDSAIGTFVTLDCTFSSRNYYLSWQVGVAPVVSLQAVPNQSFAPYSTNLIAIASDDVEVADYSWDLNNDGYFEIDSGLNPSVPGPVPSQGSFVFKVRVTDNEGMYTDAVAVATGF